MIQLFNKYIDHIGEENSMRHSDGLLKKAQEHLNELDKLILISIKLYLLLLDILSRVFFFKALKKVENKKINKLKNLLFFINFFIDKIDQIFFLIIMLHTYGDETLGINHLTSRNKHQSKNRNHYKFIVLGSGPSGAVTALELVKKFPGEVLIIEKGGNYCVPTTKHPGDEFLKKWYRGGINSTYFPEMVAYSSGTCFGGGSEINSGLYHEPDGDFLKQWASEYGTIDLDIKSMQPYIEKVNSLTNVLSDNENLFKNKFFEGGSKKSQRIVNLKRFVSHKQEKNTMSSTLLKEFIKEGGDIELDTHVNHLIFQNDVWQIDSLKAQQTMTFSSDYLFLCCGSIFTNDLLLKSNLIKKEKSTLRKFKFHPMIKIITSYDDEIQELNEDVISLQNIEFYPDLIIGNATSSLQFLISSFQKNMRIRNYINKNWKKMKIFHGTFSLGYGKIIRIPFLSEPILTYSLSKQEKQHLYEGFMKMISFIEGTGAKMIIPVKDGKLRLDECKSESSILEAIENINDFQISSVHILGGVTMGENDNCITDSYGKVKECESLYVNDSSLINTSLLKNPQGTVMSIAYRNIERFIKTYEIS